jgi:hypothetical protein
VGPILITVSTFISRNLVDDPGFNHAQMLERDMIESAKYFVPFSPSDNLTFELISLSDPHPVDERLYTFNGVVRIEIEEGHHE